MNRRIVNDEEDPLVKNCFNAFSSSENIIKRNRSEKKPNKISKFVLLNPIVQQIKLCLKNKRSFLSDHDSELSCI